MAKMPEATNRTLNRIPYFDERSRQYPMRALLRATDAMSMHWAPGAILNQGSVGHCVGFGWTQEALMSPVRVNLDRLAQTIGYGLGAEPDYVAHGIFWLIQQVDRQMGNNWPDGASVLAGAKTVSQLGFLHEYRWCFTIEEVIGTLLHHGPVVLGINWHERMFDPDQYGELFVGGRVAGGHCIVASGYHPAKLMHPVSGRPARPMIRLTNSWGHDWGQGGQAWITVDALAGLLAENGEACVPVHRSYGRKPVPA